MLFSRPENWPTLLADFTNSRAREPFRWGANDCCLFASDWILTMYGSDPAAWFRGRYTTALGAFRFLKKHGGVEGIMRAAAAKYQWDEINPKQAQRGDLCLVDTPTGRALAVCVGAFCVAPGPDALSALPMTATLKAWRT